MTHAFLTVAFPFDRACVPAVNSALDELGHQDPQNSHDPFRGRGIHFLSMTVLDDADDQQAHLLIEATVDGSLTHAQSTVCDAIGTRIQHVLKSGGVHVAENNLPAFLKKHTFETGQSLFATPGLNFTGTPGMTVKQIHEDFALSRMVRTILDTRKFNRGFESALETRDDVRKKVEFYIQHPNKYVEDYPAAIPVEPPSTLTQDILNAAEIPLLSNSLSALERARQTGLITALGIMHFLWPVGVVASLLLTAVLFVAIRQLGWGWGLLAGFVFLFFEVCCAACCTWFVYQRLRHAEITDVPDDSPPNKDILNDVMNRENRHGSAQNHMLGVSVMKTGLLRNLALRVVFWVIGQNASRIARPGFLGEIGTIHFARWILLPGTNKLLFFSNYGGSWESYLEDFITKASGGLTGVWSNTQGFPRAKNLFQDGATDADRFKRWARRQMRPTRFWYSAYPHLTTERIRINAAIRYGLSRIETEDQAAIWLSCIGSRPRQSTTLETADIQQIVFGGLRSLPYARCLLIRLPDNSPKAQEWLRMIEPEISYGDQSPGACSRLLAVSATGLSRLGLNSDELSEFPIAFTQGMSAPHRSRFLGDTGEDAPENSDGQSGWLWGHGQNATDVAIVLYHSTRQSLDDDFQRQIQRLGRLQAALIHTIDLKPVSPNQPTREAFGFVDGISQPIIRGSRNWTGESDPLHVVAAGEIILGYPDNRGFVPRSPKVSPSADPAHALPAIERVIADGPVPVFDPAAAKLPRDLGRNGSYLVIRQLEQKVAAFNEFIKEQSEIVAKSNPDLPNASNPARMGQWIAAKMVGRWQDGSSLVRNPEKPGGGWEGEACDRPGGCTPMTPDNSFLLGTEDPHGYRCPFGAHIRRTNPRDSLTPGSQEQVDISNRHRILRVGRPYLPNEGTENPGLLFMCLNADIERQFEFIQQTWALEKSFHGLDGEADSILSGKNDAARLTIPTPTGPLVLNRLNDFVKVRGGGYFFLPSRQAIRFLARSLNTKTAIPQADK